MNRNVTLIAVAASFFAVTPAFAQSAARSARDEVLKQLSSQFSEAPVAMGIASNGGGVEFLSAPAGQSWTIILTLPNGLSCLIAAGESWESVPAIAKRDPKA
jgi:hypothetical protein